MPAVTVDNVLALPRVSTVDPAVDRPRPVVSVTSAPSGFEGEGFPVRRAFAGVDLRALDPFIHMDQMGEVDYAPGEPKGTPWHPHRGFETVTYMIDGLMQHQDSQRRRRPDQRRRHPVDDRRRRHPAHRGTTGARRRVRAALFHGLQLWVNLPALAQVRATRATRTSPRPRSALLSSDDGGGLVRLIAGELDGPRRPGRRRTRPSRCCTRRSRRGRGDAAVARGLQRPRLRTVGRGLGRRRAASPALPDSSRSSGRARSITVAADEQPGLPVDSASTCSSSADSRSVSR